MNRNSFEGQGPELSPQKKEEEQGRELTGEEMREKLRDPSFLPSFKELARHLEPFRDHSLHDSIEWRKWDDLISEKEGQIFEIWTKEYIHALGSYLAERVRELGGTEENPTVILEVGAGNGRLTHFLQQKMDELIPGKVMVIASDSGDWKIPPAFPVETISHSEALAKYKPAIVIFSWMPYGYDCTADFRATKSVDEYILIGEGGGGCCGDSWETWGIKDWEYDEKGQKLFEQEGLSPYERDGFEAIYKEDLSHLQLSHLNIQTGHSTTSTTSFRRKK